MITLDFDLDLRNKLLLVPTKSWKTFCLWSLANDCQTLSGLFIFYFAKQLIIVAIVVLMNILNNIDRCQRQKDIAFFCISTDVDSDCQNMSQ